MRVILILLFFSTPVSTAELHRYSDQEIIESIDETTMLGKMARGTWGWSEDPVAYIP